MNENPAPSDRGRKTAIVVLVLALVAAAVWITILLMQQTGGPGQNGPGTTPAPETTTAPGPSATPATPSPTQSASDLPGTPSLPAAEAATVVWPDPGGTLRYANPEDAARGFAEDFAGFTDPVYGEFMQGDARSGELEVRPAADGPVTTVLLRQLSDGRWYAIGATSSEIQLEVPVAGERIASPVELSGSSRAFEATVNVEVRSHGSAEPLGSGIVMGGSGPDLGPFSGNVQWDNPGTGGGALLLFVSSAKDGSVWTAAAVPVGFAAQS
ncbi:Gmad2 immunoglobulin-like domain-containing protein [Paeniglutamicibacter sp. ABSL32-1]|uniref:Gmad2 immunoglobulin-like domain-containing protein n=1 Tax=Paeniglutamicibacter quisquiliarum TaxID=2849498 RepID=UPI001C2D909E|nr:Gmad2 immunoglobulin-like domain-containing protein [Paeniglutamicibacter quisquiliarum]MBV1777937.1 Gmad2 immunoglobulin-like domain-containing protein [Paeniglutamicibacter quisquiliarum]